MIQRVVSLEGVSKYYFTGTPVEGSIAIHPSQSIKSLAITFQGNEQTRLRGESRIFEHKRTFCSIKLNIDLLPMCSTKKTFYPFSFDSRTTFPPTLPYPPPTKQYSWHDTLFSVEYELIVTGSTTDGKKIKQIKKLKFMPGLENKDLAQHTKFLKTGEFCGPGTGATKKMLLYSGFIHFTCKLNKRTFLANEEDEPLIRVFIDNQSASRMVTSIEFTLSHGMKVKGWSWDGEELSQNHNTPIPLLSNRIPLSIKPHKEGNFHFPIVIPQSDLQTLPPSFDTQAMALAYKLDVAIRFSGATEKLICTLPIAFQAPDLTLFTARTISPHSSFENLRDILELPKRARSANSSPRNDSDSEIVVQERETIVTYLSESPKEKRNRNTCVLPDKKGHRKSKSAGSQFLAPPTRKKRTKAADKKPDQPSL